MGIENRDYLRDDSAGYGYSRSFGGGLVAVKWLIIANVAVFVLQLLTSGQGTVTRALALGPGAVIERLQLWRLVTYAFCHDVGQIWHIFFNMYVLYIVGRRLEPRYGVREFFSFYMTAIVVSGLAYLLFELVLARPGTVIGASGAVAAAFILYAIHYPHERWLMFFVFPIEVRWLCLGFIVFDLHPVLLALGGGAQGGNVAHACHLGGYLFGYLYYAKGWHLTSAFGAMKLPKLPQRQRKSHLKVYNPHRDSPESAADLEARVDEILQKIHEHGEASLTAEERSTLSDASRRLRNRSRS
jgi:membrane associated rhomboid family serine protease